MKYPAYLRISIQELISKLESNDNTLAPVIEISSPVSIQVGEKPKHIHTRIELEDWSTSDEIEQISDALNKNTIIKGLRLSHFEMTHQNLIRLGQISSLSSLELNGLRGSGINPKSFRSFAENTSLKSLSIISCGPSLTCDFAIVLSENTTLTSLDLTMNLIRDEGVTALAKNKTLSSLNLSSNQVSEIGITALANNTHLSSLNLSNCRVGDRGAFILKSNMTLSKLDLAFNGITAEGAIALAKHPTLISLNLCRNEIDSKGATALAENKVLLSLNLAANTLRGNDVKELAKNTTLRYLDLSRNHITNKGKEAFLQNTNLLTLNCSEQIYFLQKGSEFMKAGDLDKIFQHRNRKYEQYSETLALIAFLQSIISKEQLVIPKLPKVLLHQIAFLVIKDVPAIGFTLEDQVQLSSILVDFMWDRVNNKNNNTGLSQRVDKNNKHYFQFWDANPQRNMKPHFTVEQKKCLGEEEPSKLKVFSNNLKTIPDKLHKLVKPIFFI